METFLQLVAHDLYTKIGSDFSHTAIVFPNKRAGLFFNEHLAAESNRPLWSPAYLSISDLFRQLSPLQAGDPIRLVCELYKTFIAITGSQETLDDFYFWGELLISDFDDIDKNLVDAHRLFSNLQELKALSEDTSFLSPEQGEALRQFFHNFSLERRTLLKERFLSLWDKLDDIYHTYQATLQAQGIAYEGLLQRMALEGLTPSALRHDRYVFVGFNVLNKVETELFKALKEDGKALFYWDYDCSYVCPSTPAPKHPAQSIFTHEAGEFVRRNLKLFPNELPEEHFHTLNGPSKHISLIAAPTENAQARFLPQWIQNIRNDGPIGKECAVVLCNESLLLPVLHSIPQEVQNVNITMGFPLAQTPVYSLVQACVELQTSGYQAQAGRYRGENVLALLRHPYVRRTSPSAAVLEERLVTDNRFYPLPSELAADEFLQTLFTPQTSTTALCRQLIAILSRVAQLYRPHEEDEKQQEDIFNQLYRESLFRAYTIINRLLNLIESGDLATLRTDTLKRLLNRLLTAATIPFHGEPAIGMQVMGVLETRNLDFRHLLLLSVNEGQLPKSGGDSSFIPYNLRRAFGMTTLEHQNAVYAYYFYRLLQRAETVTLLYNTSTDGLNRGEMSRFALQFLVEYPNPIHRYYLESGQTPRRTNPISVRKTPALLKELQGIYDAKHSAQRILSPSALNAYLDCSLMFYFRYVARLRTPDEVSAEIDSALFGTIFHRAAELAYTELTSHTPEIRKQDLEALLKDEVRIQSYVDTAFKEKFFHVTSGEQPEYNGTQLIHSKVIASYLKQLLRHDLAYAPFRMHGMETYVQETLEVETPSGLICLNIGGTIDRMDIKGDTLRIVDYKTGGTPKTPESIGQLFTPMPNRPNYIFQTFLYASIVCRQQKLKVAPALLYIHKAASETYSPIIEIGPSRQPKTPVTDFGPYEQEFRERLYNLLREIFDPAVPFTQTEDDKKCTYCDFRGLCRR